MLCSIRNVLRYGNDQQLIVCFGQNRVVRHPWSNRGNSEPGTHYSQDEALLNLKGGGREERLTLPISAHLKKK